MHTPSSTLSTLIAEWQSHGWPLHTLTAFRMEGDGGGEGGQAGGDAGAAGGDGGQGPDPTAELEKWKAEARKHEQRAKANARAATELEQLRQSQMSEQEKAVAQAVAAAQTAARAEVLAEVGGKLVQAEIRAAAAGRLADEQVAAIVESLNVAPFLTEAGDVDTAKVTEYVDRIAPKGNDTGGNGGPTLDLGQGARGGGGSGKHTALNGDPLLQSLKDKVGAR